MAFNDSKLQLLRRMVSGTTVIRTCDLAQFSIPQKYLRVLCDEGALTKIARGIYASTAGLGFENASLAHVVRVVPQGNHMPALGVTVS